KLGGIEAGAQVNQDISGKVDKVAGKGLSTEDYSTADKNKLGGLAVLSKAGIEAVLTGGITSHTHLSRNLVYCKTLLSANDILNQYVITNVLVADICGAVLLFVDGCGFLSDDDPHEYSLNQEIVNGFNMLKITWFASPLSAVLVAGDVLKLYVTKLE
ncbi:MAG: hypothetical protein WCR20_11905, partial [Verrucomicrobiota bacterium]